MELNQNEPGFDFGANLETRDSMSSLERIGVSNGEPVEEVSGSTQQDRDNSTDKEAMANGVHGPTKENGELIVNVVSE